MSHCIENIRVGHKWYYIAGIPGHYCIKSCGNNRIIERDIPTLEEARNYFPGAIVVDD